MADEKSSLLAGRRWLALLLATLARWIAPDAVMYDACCAISPENDRCVLVPGHDGNHVPPRGRGWSWGS
jgi:hypothetical protein